MQQHIIEKRTQNKWDCNEHVTVSKSFTLHFKKKRVTKWMSFYIHWDSSPKMFVKIL